LVFACEEDYKANRNGVVLDCLKKKNKKIIIEIERLIEKVVHTLLLFDTHLQKIMKVGEVMKAMFIDSCVFVSVL